MKKAKAKQEAPTQPAEVVPEICRVRVVRQAIAEGSLRYSAGEVLEVTAQRRAALGTLVEDVS